MPLVYHCRESAKTGLCCLIIFISASEWILNLGSNSLGLILLSHLGPQACFQPKQLHAHLYPQLPSLFSHWTLALLRKTRKVLGPSPSTSSEQRYWKWREVGDSYFSLWAVAGYDGHSLTPLPITFLRITDSLLPSCLLPRAAL